MTVDGCLDTRTMIHIVEGRADATTLETVEAHASRCVECRRVLSSLARHDVIEPSEPAGSLGVVDDGERVGRYRIERLLGTGGMGLVFAAHDPELDRRVAIKLLRPDLGGDDRQADLQERLRREAQAMARLAHPNVVAVHDVGLFEDRIFVAMEYVPGRTLARWLASSSPAIREILDVFIAAGRGLEAAHLAGLVHRDFKPENVLVGDDGRVRVVDFGLARAAGPGGSQTVGPAAELGAVAPAAEPNKLTARGTVIGTPYYMAPEQYRGDAVDARTDQFSFCVALYTAIYGARPVIGTSAAAPAGRAAERARARVPRQLRRALHRGLSPDPRDRFPSMSELLVVLAGSRRRLVLAAAAAAIAIFGIAVVLATQRASPPPCQGARAHLRGVWSDARKAAIEDAFVRTGAPYARASAAEVAGSAERYATAWAAMHTEACQATHVRGEQTQDLLGLRMACLDGRLRQFGALLRALATADRGVTEHAVDAIHALPRLDVCADIEALSSAVRPPADPATRERVAALTARLVELRGLRDAGLYPRARDGVAALLGEVHALGYRPLEAETLELSGLLAEDTSDFAAAETALREAALAAEAGRHDRVLVSALTESISIVGYHRGRPAEAEPLRRRAEAALERIGRPPDLEAALFDIRGRVAVTAGAYPEARRHFQAELALIEREVGPDDLRVARPLHALGRLCLLEDQAADALPLFDRALALERRVYSDDHPEVADALEALGGAQYALARYADAEANYLRAQRVYERAFGPDDPHIANVMKNRANVYAWQGKPNEGIALLRRAIAIDDKALGPDHPTTLAHLRSLAVTLEAASQYAEATAILTRVRTSLRAQFGADHPALADATELLAIVKLAEGKPAEARDLAQASLAMYQRTLGDRYRPLSELRTLGGAHLALGEPGKAVDALDAAHASVTDHDDPGERAWIESLLGRALVESGRDVARGRALVRAAWRHIRADDRMDDQRAPLATWMRAHHMPPDP